MDPQVIKEIVLKILDLIVHLTFPAIVFTIGSQVAWRDFVAEFKRPELFLKIFLVGSILVPLITAGLLKLFHLPLIVAAIMLVAAVAPGDSFALLEAEGKRGRVSLAAATMAWLCLTMPFTVPLWLWIFNVLFPFHFKVGPAGLFATIAPLTLLPLLAGVLLRECAPKLSAILFRISKPLATFLLMTATAFGVILGIKGLAHFTLQAVAAIFLATTIALFLGYYCGGAERKDRISMGLTASLGNFAVIILVAHLSYPAAHVLKEAVAFVIIRWCVIMFWYLAMRLKLRLAGETL
jgi:bile acid:Na+ symporter, BASS family